MKNTPVVLKIGMWLSIIIMLVIVVEADLGLLPDCVMRHIKYRGGDKLGHFYLIGGLNFMVCIAHAWGRDRMQTAKRLLSGTVILLFAATAEEFSQKWIPIRTFSWEDLFWSYAGIFCFGLFAAIILFTIIWLRGPSSPETARDEDQGAMAASGTFNS